MTERRVIQTREVSERHMPGVFMQQQKAGALEAAPRNQWRARVGILSWPYLGSQLHFLSCSCPTQHVPEPQPFKVAVPISLLWLM